jgi:multimeric flavodoxin WrbA
MTKQLINKTISHLKQRRKILFIVTSNRWVGEKGSEKPKSTRLAEYIAGRIGKRVKVLDAGKIKIYPCEGNVSTAGGNTCGPKEALLKSKFKNPSGFHRCWASINNPDDELWKISKELFKSDAVVFFGSVRWGQANAIYQKLIERLNWIENRHTTLSEKNIIKDIEAGIILLGQNWNGQNVLKTEKQVLKYYGFKVPPSLSWNWQYTQDATDETNESYLKAVAKFNSLI